MLIGLTGLAGSGKSEVANASSLTLASPGTASPPAQEHDPHLLRDIGPL
jgi:hypothetical protein